MAKLLSGTRIYGNVTVDTFVTATGNVTGGNVLTAGQVSATANVTGGNILTAGIMSSTGNATHGNVITAGGAYAQVVYNSNTLSNGTNINASGYNAMLVGPITIANGASVTVTTTLVVV